MFARGLGIVAVGDRKEIFISRHLSLERRLGQPKPIRFADGRGSDFGGRIINIEHRTSLTPWNCSQYSTGELQQRTSNARTPDAKDKGGNQVAADVSRLKIDSPNLIVDSGKPAVSIRHDQADQGQKLKTGSQERREENEEGMKKSEERRKTMTFEDLEGWQPARQLSEVGGESRRTPQKGDGNRATRG